MFRMMKKAVLSAAAAAVFSLAPAVLPEALLTPVSAEAEVPEEIFQWVQSTARQNYYFNRQEMAFGVREDGTIDTKQLIVPTLRTYDDVMIRDVTAKRRWKGESMEGYRDLAGCAEYLKFDLSSGTVTVTRHDDLDSGWGILSSDTEPETVKLSELSEKDVDGIFYRAILDFAKKHREEIIAQTNGVYRPEEEQQEKKEAKEAKPGHKAHKSSKRQRHQEKKSQQQKAAASETAASETAGEQS